MTDTLQMLLFKPQFSKIKDKEKAENRMNLANTALGLGILGAGAYGLKKAENKYHATEENAVKTFINEVTGSKTLQNMKKFFTDEAKEGASRTKRFAVWSTNLAKKGKTQLNKILPENKYARRAIAGGAALLVALHIYDKAKIKSKYEGYESANNITDKVVEDFKEVGNHILGALGFQKQEN